MESEGRSFGCDYSLDKKYPSIGDVLAPKSICVDRLSAALRTIPEWVADGGLDGALEFAIVFDWPEIASVLLGLGASVNAMSQGHLSPYGTEKMLLAANYVCFVWSVGRS